MVLASLQSGGACVGWEILTSLIDGCCQGHEPPKIGSKKLWLKFPCSASSKQKWKCMQLKEWLKKICSEWLMYTSLYSLVPTLTTSFS